MSKVLVVDDDEDIVDSVCTILSRYDFDVICLYDCRQVVAKVIEEQPLT